MNFSSYFFSAAAALFLIASSMYFIAINNYISYIFVLIMIDSAFAAPTKGCTTSNECCYKNGVYDGEYHCPVPRPRT